MKKVTIKQASEIIGLSPLSVRWGIINGTLPIGSYIKVAKSKKTVYNIIPERLAKYKGISLQKLMRMIEENNYENKK